MTIITNRIVSVSLFKNGFAVLKRLIRVSGSGEHVFPDTFNAIHGTLWIEGNVEVEMTGTIRNIETQRRVVSSSNFLQSLQGHEVSIILDDGDQSVIKGRVETLANGRLVLQEVEDSDYIFVDIDRIKTLKLVNGYTISTTQEAPVIVMNVKRDGESEFILRYLVSGLAWTPAYNINVINESSLTFRMQSVIKNQYETLGDVAIELISGFPNLEFQNVESPLSPKIDLASFFDSLEERDWNRRGGISSNARVRIQSQRRLAQRYKYMEATGTVGDSTDLYYMPIGYKTLNKGEALLVELAKEDTEYRRVVEWFIPDSRNADGQARFDPDEDEMAEEAWDSLVFINPLKHPLTTAPAEITEQGQFRGQTTINWANPGEEVVVRVTKALSMGTLSTEQEEPDSRETLRWGGAEFQETSIKGELQLINLRNVKTEVLIRRGFTGTLSDADGKPELVLRNEGVISANPRNELRWKVNLGTGETLKLTYRYRVLVLIE